MLYSITYNKPHNPHTTAPRNASRRVSIRAVKGLDAMHAAVRDITAHGFAVLSVRDNTGKIVA